MGAPAGDDLDSLRQEVARLRATVEAQQALLDTIAARLGVAGATSGEPATNEGQIRPQSVASSDTLVDDDLWRRLGLAEGERRTVTVLFADVTGYTELSERLDPEETQLIMRDTMAALAGCVQRHEGYLEKFIGDALCAVFGAPVAHEDEPQRAARAALEMHRALAEKAARRPDLPPLTVHIGINTGIVIAGTVGDGSQFGVMGDTINTAARLMGMATSGQTFVSAETARRLRRQFRLASKGLHKVKGKAHAVAVFDVVEEVAGGDGRGVTHLEAPLVDRQAELAALHDVLDGAATERQGATVVVIGEAGVGKTRVVSELVDWATESWRVVRSSSRLAGDQPFALLAGALAPLVGELPDGPDKDAAAVLSHPTGAVPPDFEIVLARVLSAAATRWPLLVVLEDVDRADEGSVELAHYLSRATVDEPVVFLLVARRAPGAFIGHEGATIMRLQPLDDDATAALFDGLLPGALNGVQRARLARRADGNPTFASEIAYALVDEGVAVERDDGGWRLVGDPEAMQIPGSVTELIEARIDGLATATRMTLQEASVIGARFRGRLLERVSTVPSSLPAALAELDAADLIAPPSADEEFWSFRSQLVRDVAYHSILRRRRPAAHRAVADALIELEPDRIDENAELVSHHYALSDEPALALPFLARGLSHALDAHSTAGAAAIARKAIAIATRHPDQIDSAQLAWFHERLGVCRFLLGEPDGAESFAAAVAVHEARGDTVKAADGTERLGWYLTLLGNPAAAAEHLARVEKVVESGVLPPDAAGRMRPAVTASRAFAAAAAGRLAAARRKAASAATEAAEADDPFTEARARMTAGVVELWDGTPLAAIDHLQAGLDLAWSQHHVVLADRCGRWLTTARVEAGEYAAALALAEPLLARADERNDASVGVGVRAALSSLWRELGDLEEARRLASEAIILARGRSVASDALAEAHLTRAHCELDGRTGPVQMEPTDPAVQPRTDPIVVAEEHLRGIDDLLRHDPWLSWRLGARAELARARLAVTVDDLDRAQQGIEQARRRLGEAAAVRERIESDRLEGEVLVRLGYPAGVSHVERALSGAQRFGSPFVTATVLVTLARLASATDATRASTALGLLEEALDELDARAPAGRSGMVRASALASEAKRLHGLVATPEPERVPEGDRP